MADRRLTTLADVPTDGTAVYTVERDGERREVLLARPADGVVVAWANHCQHWTDVRLDRGEGPARRGDEIVCRKHGAMFDLSTGVCTWGPCEGATLDPVAVSVEDGAVHLAEPDWSVVGPGVDDDGEPDTRGGLDW